VRFLTMRLRFHSGRDCSRSSSVSWRCRSISYGAYATHIQESVSQSTTVPLYMMRSTDCVLQGSRATLLQNTNSSHTANHVMSTNASILMENTLPRTTLQGSAPSGKMGWKYSQNLSSSRHECCKGFSLLSNYQVTI